MVSILGRHERKDSLCALIWNKVDYVGLVATTPDVETGSFRPNKLLT